MAKSKTSANKTFLNEPWAILIAAFIGGAFLLIATFGGNPFSKKSSFETTPATIPACQANTSSINIPKVVVETNEIQILSVRADNPEGRALTFSWQTVVGTVDPIGPLASSQTRYVAPPQPGGDTISVKIDIRGCPSIILRQEIDIVAPRVTPTTFLTTTPTQPVESNPSPSVALTNTAIVEMQTTTLPESTLVLETTTSTKTIEQTELPTSTTVAVAVPTVTEQPLPTANPLPILKYTLTGQSSSSYGVAFSPNGAPLLASSSVNGVSLWDTTNGNRIRILPGDREQDGVKRIAFSSDGQLLATAANYGVQIWRVSDGSLQLTIPVVSWAVAFSPDGQFVATEDGFQPSVVKLWRISDGKHVQTFEGPIDGVFTIAFSPDGTMIAAAGRHKDSTVWLWRVSGGTLLHALRGHESSITDLTFIQDGQTLASASLDKTVRLWSTVDGSPGLILQHSVHVESLAGELRGTLLASGTEDNFIHLWRIPDGNLISSFTEPTGGSLGIMSLASSPDGRQVAAGCADGAVRLWQLP